MYVYIYIYNLYILIEKVMSCQECYIRFIITKQEGHRPQGQGDYKPDIAQGGMTAMTSKSCLYS